MRRTREIERLVRREVGGRSVAIRVVTCRSGHYRVVLSAAGRSRFGVTSGSPSDTRTAMNFRSTLRAELKRLQDEMPDAGTEQEG